MLKKKKNVEITNLSFIIKFISFLSLPSDPVVTRKEEMDPIKGKRQIRKGVVRNVQHTC